METIAEVGCSETYLAIVGQGFIQLHLGNLDSAEKLFRNAQLLAPSVESERACDLLPLALYCQSLLHLRRGLRDQSKQVRELAAARLDKSAPAWNSWKFHNLMADVLMEVGDHQRAIPFCEKAIEYTPLEKTPITMAEMLMRLGLGYTKSGLRDHAIAPLRAAVKIFRNCPGDPRLALVLITLGNALRKTCPAEAESCYQEVADLHLAQGQIESATVPWVNLGIVCSEQGRHQEALDHYQRVLKVREGILSTPVDRLASVMNNIANCYRRMKKFGDALESVDRAIALLEPAGASPILASAYGTRGLIFLDDGRDSEAVEWLEKSYRVNEQIPSANLETVVEDLEKQLAALQRLGREEAQRVATERLDQVRAKIQSVHPADHKLRNLQTKPAAGAVLIDIGFGLRFPAAERRSRATSLIYQLSEVIEGQQVGHIGGEVVIPESTTLIFYGPDGEALFRAMEPVLRSQPVCAGATVTIRQQDRSRTVVLARVVN